MPVSETMHSQRIYNFKILDSECKCDEQSKRRTDELPDYSDEKLDGSPPGVGRPDEPTFLEDRESKLGSFNNGDFLGPPRRERNERERG